MSAVSLVADTTAVCTAINAQFTGGDRAFPPDKSSSKAASHMSVWVYRTYNGEYLASGEARIDTGRVVVRHICKTWADLDVFRAKTRAALEDHILPSGIACRFETEGDIDTDEGWWVCDDSYTYAP